MTNHKTLTHHMLRRTARAKKNWLREIQASARSGNSIAMAVLSDYGISAESPLKVESTMRGPFGWRVVGG